MLKILYGVTDNEDIAHLKRTSFQDFAILNVKFIAKSAEGITFSALVDENKYHLYPPTTCIKYFIFENHTSNRKQPKATADTLNARRKLFRKRNNLHLNQKNWKQFSAPKNAVIARLHAMRHKLYKQEGVE